MTQFIVVNAPRVELQIPDEWGVTNTPSAMAAFTGPLAGGFVTNVVVQQQRVDPNLSIATLAETLIGELRTQTTAAVVRSSEAHPGQIDRVVDVVASGVEVVMYQRLLLLAGTQGSHWLVVLEASCHASTEAETGPELAAILASVSVS